MRALLLAVFLAALAGIVAAVDGPSVRDMCNGECPLKAEAVSTPSRSHFDLSPPEFLRSDHHRSPLTSSAAVTPYPPVKGSVATLNVRGELSGASVEGGTIITTTYYKVARSMWIIASPSQLIFWVKGKTTNNDTCDVRLVPDSAALTPPALRLPRAARQSE